MSKNYVLSFSYGDYRRSIGGTDKVIMAHQEMLNDAGLGYIYAFPMNIRNTKPKADNHYWCVIEDGKYTGVMHTQTLINYLVDLSKKGVECNAVCVHHLKNVCVSDLREIVCLLDTKVYVYIHDYYNICLSTNLLRSDSELCAGVLSEESCAGCAYYEASVGRRKAFTDLCDSVRDLTFVCPSHACETVFHRAYPEYVTLTKVVYHQKFVGTYEGNKTVNSRLRVGFCGSQINLKGWDVFVCLARQHPEYDFYYFGKKEVNEPNIVHIPVVFKRGDMNAMTDALRTHSIDCVLLWSRCQETYSYTYYEAMAANCFIITNEISGNIKDQVRKNSNGLALHSEEELERLFADEPALRKHIGDFKSIAAGPMELIENDDIVEYYSKSRKRSFSLAKTPVRITAKMTEHLLDLYVKVRRRV